MNTQTKSKKKAFFSNVYPHGIGNGMSSLKDALSIKTDGAIAIVKITITGRKVTTEVVHEF